MLFKMRRMKLGFKDNRRWLVDKSGRLKRCARDHDDRSK